MFQMISTDETQWEWSRKGISQILIRLDFLTIWVEN